MRIPYRICVSRKLQEKISESNMRQKNKENFVSIVKGTVLTAKKSNEAGGGASKTSFSNPSTSFSYSKSPALLMKAAGNVALSFSLSSLLTVRDSPSDPTFSYKETKVTDS